MRMCRRGTQDACLHPSPPTPDPTLTPLASRPPVTPMTAPGPPDPPDPPTQMHGSVTRRTVDSGRWPPDTPSYAEIFAEIFAEIIR